MPDFDEMFTYKFDTWVVQIPLGILGNKDWGKFIERKQTHKVYPVLPFNQTLRDDQVKALDDLKQLPVGIMHASTGVGKSYMILHTAATIQRKTLIFVNATTTLSAMVKRCQSFIGVTPVVYGWTKKYKSTTDQIHIAMINSAHNVKLLDFWCILADECDLYVSTDIRQKVWFNVSPDYQYAFSATMKVNMQEERLIHLYYWDIHAKILEQNFIPKIKVINTRYRCPFPLDKNADHSKLQTHISQDVDRNNLIVQTIYDTLPKTETKKGLVLTKRTEQTYALQALLEAKGIKTHVIVGEVSEEDRKEIDAKILATEETVVLIGAEKILGRWYDMPPLQSVYIVFPNRFSENLLQLAGRVLRLYPGKTYAQVFDFVDDFNKALRSQFYARKRVYKKTYWVVVN